MAELRPNVALLLLNSEGRLLICERFKIRNAWQFPQGGVDEGESLDEALVREVEEEVGLPPGCYDIEEVKGGYQYFYPGKGVKKKSGRFAGQEQTYYQCRLHEGAPEIDLSREPREFRDYRWIVPEEFELDWLPDFKREVYREVMKDFFEVEL